MSEAQASVHVLESPARPRARAKTGTGRDFNTTVHGLRGLAAFMVFIAHMLGGIGENVYFDRPVYLGLVEAPWNFGRWGVWLFFVISGYVILPSVMRYSPGEFALRRFFRLYPLFLAFSLLFIVLNAVSNAFPGLNSTGTIISALLMVNLLTHTEQLTPNAWSLSYEVVFYALTCLIFHAAARRRDFLSAGVLAFVAGLMISRYPAMAFFIAGIAARLAEDAELRPAPAVRIPLEIAAFLGCLYFASVRHYTFSLDDLNDPRVYGVFVSTALYFWMAVQPASLTSRLLDNRAIFYLGTVSYSLYLAHPYTYFAMRQLFVRMGLFGDSWAFSVGLFLAVTIPLTLLFTHCVYVLLERYPYRWFFHERVFHR